MGRDGEDAQAVEPLPCVFEQGRVALFADDLFVDGARLIGIEKLRFGGAAVDLHREAVELAAGRDREEVGALELEGVGIVKELVDLGHRHLVGDLDVDVVVAHLERGHDGGKAWRQVRRPRDDDHAVGVHQRRGAKKYRDSPKSTHRVPLFLKCDPTYATTR